MKLNFIVITLSLIILISGGCQADYDIDQYFKEFTPRVVLNSIISPEEPIVGNLNWSKYYADTTRYKVVESFSVELYENGKLLVSLQCGGGLFVTNIYPEEAKTYSLKITVPNYGEVSASTTIPTPVTSTVECVKMVEADPDNTGNPYRFSHFKVTEISSKEAVRSVWIMAHVYYRTDDPFPSQNGSRNYYLYSDSEFVDKLNARKDLWCLEAKGSNVRYSQYIRVAYSDFNQALPLNFSIEATGRAEDERSHQSEQTDPAAQVYIPTTPMFTVVNFTTPSTDYDQYQESIFESFYIDPFGSGGSSVYSNVENGLGIFAGYSCVSYRLDVNAGRQ